MATFLKRHRLIILLTLLCGLLALIDLGDVFFWADEGETLVLGQAILRSGFPQAAAPDYSFCSYLQMTRQGLWVAQPWLPFYLAAFAIALFGKSVALLRLPFVLIGVACVPALWMLGARLGLSERRRLWACLLLGANVSFLLLIRNVRYYPLPPLLTIILLILYIDLRQGRTSRWPWIGVVTALFLHTMPPMAAAIVAALFLSAAVFEPDRHLLRRLFYSQLLALGLFLPWFLYAGQSLAHFYAVRGESTLGRNMGLGDLLLGAALFAIDLVRYHFPALLLIALGILKLTHPKVIRPELSTKDAGLLLISIVLACVLMSFFFNSNLWPGYLAAVFPLLALVTAELIGRITCGSSMVGGALTAVVLFSTALNLPLWPWLKGSALVAADEHRSEKRLRLLPRLALASKVEVPLVDYLFKELAQPYEGPVEGIVKYMRVNAKAGDTFFVNHDGHSIRFATDLARVQEIPFTQPPDWLIQRGGNSWGQGICEAHGLDADAYIAQFLATHRYEMIELDYPDLYHENIPILPFHAFETPPFKRRVVLFHYRPT